MGQQLLTKKKEYPENSFGLRKTDFNGDGLEDILSFKTSFDAVMNRHELDKFSIYYGDETNILNATSTDVTPTLIEYNGNNINKFLTHPHLHESFFIGDFNGDGRSDILAMGCGSSTPHFLFIYEQGLNPKAVSPINFSQLATHNFKAEVVDFDGDGKSELILLGNTHCYIYSFEKQANGKYNAVQIALSGYPNVWHDIYPGDFNGDGKTDFLTSTNNGTLWEVALATGKQFTASTFVFNHLPNSPFQTTYNRILLGDYNGDGKTDIFHVYNDDPVYTPTDNVSVYYSTGQSFRREDASGTNLTGMLTLSDINGDGRADILKQTSIGGAPWCIFLKPSGKENLLQKVKDGLGRVVVFDYKRLNEGNGFYSRTDKGSYPLLHIQGGVNIVSSLTLPDGLGGSSVTSYFYEDGIVHRTGRGFLGFEKVTGINANTDSKVENYFEVGPYNTLQKKEDKNYLSSTAQLLSHTTYDISYDNTIAACFFQKINRVTEHNALTGATTITDNSYDNDGNIDKVIVDVNNIEEITTTTTYIATGANNIKRPSLVSIQKRRTNNPLVKDEVSFTYDNLGRLLTKTEHGNKPMKKITTYGYNGFGNLTSEILSASIMPYTSNTSCVYDSKGRFPISVTNPLGQTATTTWDYRWGKPLETTGIDDVKTINTYDSWSKLTASTVKYWGSVTAYTVTYTDGWDLMNGMWYTKVTHPGRPDVKTWYDLLGREVKTETEHYNSQNVYTEKSYENTGKLKSVTQPHLLSESTIKTTYSYNAYGLISGTSDAYGTTNYSYSYGNGNTTTTISNPKGQTVTVTDAAGRVLEQTDNGGKLTTPTIAEVMCWL